MARPEKPSRVIYYVRKDTMKEYSLMKMIVKDGKILSDEVLHRDIPVIVYGKLSQHLRNQGMDNA